MADSQVVGWLQEVQKEAAINPNPKHLNQKRTGMADSHVLGLLQEVQKEAAVTALMSESRQAELKKLKDHENMILHMIKVMEAAQHPVYGSATLGKQQK